MQIKVQVHVKWIKCTICCQQFPITAAYVFTDYWLQGQTLPYILVNIASLPCATPTLFNLYVALSRILGQYTVRLLWDFNKDLFMQCHDVALMEEDDRLEELLEIRRFSASASHVLVWQCWDLA